MIMDRLLSPSLVTLSAIVERTDSIVDFLENCIELGPRLKLKSLKFDIYQAVYFIMPITSLEIHQLSQAVATHQHLESLEVSVPIDDAALTPVILSPELRMASLVIHPKESNLDNIQITSTDIPFRSVKELELHVWDLNFVPSLLRAQDQVFHTFGLRLTGVHDPMAISSFLIALASPQRTDTMQSLTLTFRNSFALSHGVINIFYDHSNHRLTYNTLLPLTSFKHLRELVVSLLNHVFLNDEEFVELVRNWPMLEVLVFKCSHGCFGTPITLEGLLSLLKLCPRLRGLSLSLDARDVPPSGDACNTILRAIGLPDSPIRDARLVADFLSKHIPSVTSVNVNFIGARPPAYRPPEEYQLQWQKVNEYLQEG